VIITCPNCQTRYKVAAEAIGAVGRQVQCATCESAWTATPVFPQAANPLADADPDDDELAFGSDRDSLFSPEDEEMLDAAFRTHDQPAPALASAKDETAADASLAKKRDLAFAQRRKAIARSLPLARLRRISRVVVAVLLVGVIAGFFGMRTELVRAFPALDGIYRTIGLGTNVVGLDFADVKTLRTTRDGTDVLMVTAVIVNATSRLATVPPVLVSLMGEGDAVVYEWSVTPAARSIHPGDVLSIDTQLTAPPQGVDRVRLTFVHGQGRLGEQPQAPAQAGRG
jgi:predicted Zn finger-like uncharacterized protein